MEGLRGLGGLFAGLSELLGAVLGALLRGGARWGPAAAVAAGWWALRARAVRRSRRGGRRVGVGVPPTVDPAGAAALWTNLHQLAAGAPRRGFGGRTHVGFEYVWSAAGLAVGLWVPDALPEGSVEAAVEAAWPAAATSVTRPAPPPLPAEGLVCVGGRLRLAGPEHLPLRTEHPADPLRPILGAVGVPAAGEATVVQILARPAGRGRITRCHRAARTLRSGRPAGWGALFDLLTPGGGAPPPAAEDPARAGVIRAILEKASHPGWEIDLRYAVCASAADPQAIRRLRGRAHTLAAAFACYSGRNRLAAARLTRPAAALTGRRLGRGMLLSVPELAALAHLPTDANVVGLSRAGAARVPAPLAVPSAGKILGDTEVGPRRAVALAPADARHHLHLLGATGCGKSTLLTNLILSDITAGRGVVVVDPKGDLVIDLLDRIPAQAAERVVLLDPDDAAAPPSLNMLDAAEGDAELVVDHVVGIFRRIFEAHWGPRTDDVLRAGCLTLMRSGAATLADVPRLLSNPAMRARRVAQLDDPLLRGFWSWYEQQTAAEQSRVAGPVMNKLRALLLRSFARDVLGSAASSFDLRDVLDGGVALVRIPKGILGDDTARLLGSFIVAKTWQAAAGRARRGETARVDAALYVDEAQNFLTLPRSFDEMFAEARGYRLSLVLAHQHLAQLPRLLGDAVSGNARSKVYFTLSPEDAAALHGHVAPQLSAYDLSHLDAYQAAARLLVDGAETAAFTLRTRPLPPPVPGRAAAIRDAARRAHGRTPQQRRAAALGDAHRDRRDPRRSPDPDPPDGSAGAPVGGSGGR